MIARSVLFFVSVLAFSALAANAGPLALMVKRDPYNGCLEAVCFARYYQDMDMFWRVKCVNRTCNPANKCKPEGTGTDDLCECNGVSGNQCKMKWTETAQDWTVDCVDPCPGALYCTLDTTGPSGVEYCCKCQ